MPALLARNPRIIARTDTIAIADATASAMAGFACNYFAQINRASNQQTVRLALDSVSDPTAMPSSVVSSERTTAMRRTFKVRTSPGVFRELTASLSTYVYCLALEHRAQNARH